MIGLTPLLGWYIAGILKGEAIPGTLVLRPLERFIHRLAGVDPTRPMATIEGSAGVLLDPAVSGDSASVKEIAAEIQQASQRLTRLVKNLLDMTRLEAGVIPLRQEPGDIRDLVGATLRRLDRELQGHPIALSIPDQLPLVPFDFLLMEQALGNIVHNAAVYTPIGAPISIAAVNALDSGADDYLTKPFSVPELLARLRVCFRHGAPADSAPVFKSGPLAIDFIKRVAMVDGREVHLTAIEFNLLRLFAHHAGKVLTHRQILKEVWGPNAVEDVQYLRVYIGHLRQKVEADPSRPQLLITEPGGGLSLSSKDR